MSRRGGGPQLTLTLSWMTEGNDEQGKNPSAERDHRANSRRLTTTVTSSTAHFTRPDRDHNGRGSPPRSCLGLASEGPEHGRGPPRTTLPWHKVFFFSGQGARPSPLVPHVGNPKAGELPPHAALTRQAAPGVRSARRDPMALSLDRRPT